MFVIFLLAILIAAAVHATVSKPKSRRRVIELFLLYLLVGYYGVCMLIAAYVHIVNWAALDSLKRWPPAGQPMHTLYAFALIGVAVASFLALRFRNEYVLAPALTGSILSFGGAYVHLREMAASGHFVLARDGSEVLFDVLVPITVLCLAIAHTLSARARDGNDGA